MLGGYRAQGRTASAALRLVSAARALEGAGCCAVVLEAMPPVVAEAITARLQVPTIGIGAGSGCDGQVLVWHDLLGASGGPAPRFVKRYADLSHEIARALECYAADVKRGVFPGEPQTYAMPEDERTAFLAGLAHQAGQ
jgi:3-methyl-2-oxobutanoate hydroxymethyltransferase